MADQYQTLIEKMREFLINGFLISISLLMLAFAFYSVLHSEAEPSSVIESASNHGDQSSDTNQK